LSLFTFPFAFPAFTIWLLRDTVKPNLANIRNAVFALHCCFADRYTATIPSDLRTLRTTGTQKYDSTHVLTTTSKHFRLEPPANKRP